MLLGRKFDFLGGYLVVTARYLVVTARYCSLPGGYCSLLVVTARYRCLLLVPTFRMNEMKLEAVEWQNRKTNVHKTAKAKPTSKSWKKTFALLWQCIIFGNKFDQNKRRLIKSLLSSLFQKQTYQANSPFPIGRSSCLIYFSPSLHQNIISPFLTILQTPFVKTPYIKYFAIPLFALCFATTCSSNPS